MGDHAKNVTINNPNVFQMVLRGLNGGSKYQIAVSAFTSVGEGPRSPWISFTVGCGGNFNQSFGTIHLQKSDYNKLQCNWTIGSVRITNAVILLSLKELRFDYCGSEFLKVFSSSGSEIFTRDPCFEDHRDVVELQFGERNFVTLQIQLYSRYSHLNLEFVIVRRSLHSALSPSSAWNIHGFNTSQKGLFVDWSNVPRDLQADIFILSLNQTKPRLYHKDGGRNSFLIIADSSNTSVNVSDLPVFSQYIVLVYLVDVNGDIYKSDSIVVQTDEGVPRRGPYLYNWNINVRDHSISFTREDIRPEDVQGRILGYNITHAQLDELNNTKWMITDTNTTRITLSNLEEGSTYLIGVAGFTRKGTGEYAFATVTLCGGLVKEPLEELSFQKGDKITENECQWNIGDIYEPNGDHVILAIDPVDSCSFRIVVKDGYGKNLLYSYCGLRDRAFLSTSILNISVEVRAYSKYNTFTARYAILNGSIYKAPLVDGWNVTVVNASESSITFQWPNLTDVRLGNQVRAYVAIVETTDGKEIAGDIVFPNVTSITLSGLEGGTEYRLFAVVVDVLGQPHRSSEVLLFTEEGVPSRSPYVSVNNNYPGGDSINISIHPIPEKYHNGKLLGYNIKYRTSCYGIPNFSAQVDVSASTRSYLLTGLLPGKQYYIRVAGFTSKGIGPYYGANTFTTCEPQRTLTAKNGTLYSPNYPCSFRGLHYCRWTIEPQLGGSTVKAIWINFNSFRVGDGPYCRVYGGFRICTGSAGITRKISVIEYFGKLGNCSRSPTDSSLARKASQARDEEISRKPIECQRSYVTQTVNKKLQLPVVVRNSLLIKTFGESDARLRTCEIVQVGIKTLCDETVYIQAYVVPVICGPLTQQSTELTQSSYQHLRNLLLPDRAARGVLAVMQYSRWG
ncbi:receptor-type tyrosine-protein phosphatase F-like [Montipora capricornis]|uniref:receptor-type tyrosine-protein phosphatase F-like n=1 Tax=Montipora capricornis TaxID=246305 RepID=UPI0035F16A8E